MKFPIRKHAICVTYSMEEKSRSQLETQWRSIDPQYSYSDWEAKRRDDWQRIISQRLPELGKSIAVDSGLFTYLQSKAVFDRRTIETFKVISFLRHCHSYIKAMTVTTQSPRIDS